MLNDFRHGVIVLVEVEGLTHQSQFSMGAKRAHLLQRLSQISALYMFIVNTKNNLFLPIARCKRGRK